MQAISAHPDFANLFQALKDSSLYGPWIGQVFRTGIPQWMSPPYQFTGIGAALFGGRWNVRRLMTANYFSLSPTTAAAEFFAEAERSGFAASSLQTTVMIAATATVNKLVDLREARIRKRLGVSAGDLVTCAWEAEQDAGREPLTQAIARAIFENGGEGLLAPSARNRSEANLVLFPSNLRAGSSIVLIDEENIPFKHGLT